MYAVPGAVGYSNFNTIIEMGKDAGEMVR